MSKQALVTGAAGYIGSVLCEHLLDAGYRVVALDNLMYRQQSLFHLCANSSFEFVRGDARDERLIKEKIKSHELESAPKKAFKIDISLILYGDTWSLGLSLSWSETVKKVSPSIIIDLHPELDINE